MTVYADTRYLCNSDGMAIASFGPSSVGKRKRLSIQKLPHGCLAVKKGVEKPMIAFQLAGRGLWRADLLKLSQGEMCEDNSLPTGVFTV